MSTKPRTLRQWQREPQAIDALTLRERVALWLCEGVIVAACALVAMFH